MGILFIPQAPHITPGAVIAQKQSAVQHHTRPESGAEGDTKQVSVSADLPAPAKRLFNCGRAPASASP